MSLSVRPLLLLMSVLLFSACGGRPTIPVEEYSSVKPPKQKEVYIRATPQSQIAAPVSRTVDRSVQEPVVYEAVEPEPVWRELPPATEPAPRYQPPKRVEPMAKSPAKKNIRSAGDDPLLGLLQKIEQAMQQEDYQYAEGLLERALRIDSQRAGLWHDLGRGALSPGCLSGGSDAGAAIQPFCR